MLGKKSAVGRPVLGPKPRSGTFSAKSWALRSSQKSPFFRGGPILGRPKLSKKKRKNVLCMCSKAATGPTSANPNSVPGLKSDYSATQRIFFSRGLRRKIAVFGFSRKIKKIAPGGRCRRRYLFAKRKGLRFAC